MANLAAPSPVSPPEPSASNDAEAANIRKHWEPLDTPAVLAAWVEHNDKLWRPETFQIIKSILEERGVAVPPQRPKIELPPPSVDIPIDRRFRALLSSTPASIRVLVCAECGQRIRRQSWGKLAKVGWGLAGVTFLFAAFHPPRNQLEWDGAGGSFWLGAVLGWLGDYQQRHSLGISATRVSKDRWRFGIKHPEVASAFEHLNLPVEDSK